MHTWPSYHRQPNPSSNSSKKNKNNSQATYPVLEHGAIEAATLVLRNGRFEWDSLVSAEPTASQFRVSGFLAIFPATKPPPLPELITTTNQRADQGAHFLRKRFPDVDISADVIRNQVTEDTLQSTELAKFDPFEGNNLNIITGHDKTKYLVFPMGELGVELNLTPFSEDAEGKTVVKPTVTPTRTFRTPIQQITSSDFPQASEVTEWDTLLGVRTYGVTSLIKLPHTERRDAVGIGGLQDLACFTSHDTDGASIVDVRLFPPFDAFLANKKGKVFGCSLTGGRKTMVKLYNGPDSPPTSPFWRIGRGSRPTECTVLSGKSFNQLDLRSNEITVLHTETSTKDFLTSSEDYAQDGLFRLCSTSQIIWLDPRYPRKPLLGYKHHRDFDRTLQSSTFFLNGSHTTFLSSKRNSLLSIYDVSRHEDELVRVGCPPYGILPSGTYHRFTGHAFLQHGSHAITIFRTDEQAGVNCLELRTSAGGVSELHGLVVVEESAAVKELEKKFQNMKADSDIFGDREKVVTDLFPAYDRIFRLYAEEQEKVEEELAEKFYDVMDQLPVFWQTNDIPSEHMLTSYDIAFRTHNDPTESSRSDFATGSLINSARGFRAVSYNKFPKDELRRNAPWHLNIADSYHRIDPSLDLTAGARDLAESLRSYDLIKNDDRTILSIRRENQAREQLAVDLTLSKDIYSPNRFAPLREVGNDLETMTEALSLGHDTDEPPEVEFGYLTPVIKKKKDYYVRDYEEEKEGKDTSTEGASLPMGVRLLLKGWEVGTKAKDCIFEDPYNITGTSGSRHIAHHRLQKLREVNTTPNISQPINSQRPPTIMPSQPLASSLGTATQPAIKQPSIAVQSQRPLAHPNDILRTQGTSQQTSERIQSQAPHNSSQRPEQYMESTQVLPGSHDRRPSFPRKSMKKRLGGF